MRLEIDRGPADAEIDAFLDACAQSVAQQTTAWRDVLASVDRDEPHFLGCRAGGRLVGVLPAYRFDGPLGAILTSVPQAGPLGGVAAADVPFRPAVHRALVEAFLVLARERGCDLASLITSPFWPDRELCYAAAAPDFVLENACQVLDLEPALDPDGSFRGGSRHLRRQLRRAGSGALRVDEAQTERNVADWYCIHAERHTRIGATPLPEALFRAALAHAVPREKARFFFVRRTDDDSLVGGGLYLCHGLVCDALMPSIRMQERDEGAAYLLALHSMRWARARGVRHYNWQGSPPRGGVRRFKAQWGSRDLPYAFLTWITGDASAYLRSSVAEIQKAYPWHYVLPFDRIGRTDVTRGPSSRAGAWAALEESGR